MKKGAPEQASKRDQDLLVARWLDYLSYRLGPPSRMKRGRPGLDGADTEEDYVPELLPLVKETLLEKWFWVGVVVGLNILLAVCNATLAGKV